MKKVIKSKYFIASMLLIALIVLGVIIYYTTPKKYDKEIIYNDYTILEGHVGRIEKYDPSHAVEGYKGNGKDAYYINGKIKSKTEKGFTLITFNLYDKNNKSLGIAIAGLKELKKDETYNFKAIALENIDLNTIDHYEIKKIGNKVVK